MKNARHLQPRLAFGSRQSHRQRAADRIRRKTNVPFGDREPPVEIETKLIRRRGRGIEVRAQRDTSQDGKTRDQDEPAPHGLAKPARSFSFFSSQSSCNLRTSTTSCFSSDSASSVLPPLRAVRI